MMYRELEDNMTISQAAVNDIVSERLAAVDTLFLLFAGSLVLFMQAGFAMLCAGSVRAINVQNILLKNLFDACGGAFGFYFVGYAFAYGDVDSSGTTFIGQSKFYFQDDLENDYIAWFFQFAFAATSATIIAGTVAERCKLAAYFCYSLVLTAFIYPVVVHSIWDSHGFLSTMNDNPLLDIGMIDFAGSGVVHLTGGVAALAATIVLGPRLGRFYDQDGNLLSEPATFEPHSVALQVIGTFILWFGWYGFNPGSALAISVEGNDQVIALCAVTTTMAAAAGLWSGMLIDYIIALYIDGEAIFDLTMAMNGLLSGLVSITAGCSVLQPWAAIVTGFVAGPVYILVSKGLIKLKIDDAVDAIPVHLANGIWGCIAVGLFADPTLVQAAYGMKEGGLFYGYGGLLACELIGIVWISAWVFVTMYTLFRILSFFDLYRVSPEEEMVGLDKSKHGKAAYNFDSMNASINAEGINNGSAETFAKSNIQSCPNSEETQNEQ